MQRPTVSSAHIFAGQGAQIKGMGHDLFPLFPDLIAQANDILGYRLDRLCLDDPDGQLRDTRHTQPALFVVNALAHRRHLGEGGAPTRVAAGHSLGEYNALLAAGAFDFATGLTIVKKRAELMAGAPPGAMAAVLGLDREAVGRVLADGFGGIDIANVNTPSQTVVSGPVDDIIRAESAFAVAGCRAYIRLPVGGAFHSRLMADAAAEFASFLAGRELGSPRVPVISNVTAMPYDGDVAALLARQITSPVDWVSCVCRMLEMGEGEFVEFAPKPMLTAMIREIKAGWTPPVKVEQPVKSGVVAPERLGSAAFRAAYGTKYAYVCGAMVQGIASADMVVRCAKAGILAFFGTGGLPPAKVEAAIGAIQSRVSAGEPHGFNLLSGSHEAENVALFLKHRVRTVEASAYIRVSPELVLYRLAGLEPDGARITRRNRVMAKLSRPEVAREFLSPAPEALVRQLVAEGRLTSAQADLARRVPMADDICVEADSGGHTDQGVMTVLLPAIRRLRDRAVAEFGYDEGVGVGAGGGIGTPEAAMSAFLMGADFILTGSINQCTAEAGTSDLVKDMLQEMDVQDTDYTVAGDMFELGATIQVLKRGVLFPARANRLHDLYRHHESLDDVDGKTREMLQERYFRRSFEDVWQDCLAFHPAAVLAEAERSPRQRMALIFRWYYGLSARLALEGVADRKVDFQIHCGPALGAFNQWVAGTPLESWRERHADGLADHLMASTAGLLSATIGRYTAGA